MTDFSAFMRDCQQRVEQTLDRYLPLSSAPPERLHEAMRYSAMDGGKRVRPMLVYATGQALGVELSQLDGPAAAVEMIHVYSLIHDDLPAMDNDDLRRGRPTCHKAYDDAVAILAGDALQGLAFEVLAIDEQINSNNRLAMIRTLAAASGSLGMAGGQAIDLEAENQQLNLEQLEEMHAKKTGALIRASIQLGALGLSGIQEEQLSNLDQFGRDIGLAFQIQDDILDETGDTEKLGKPQGSDRSNNKSTFISLCGLDESRERCDSLLKSALKALDRYDDRADALRELANYIIRRDH